MTNKEAIYILQGIHRINRKMDEAVDMAIKALEQEPCDVPDINVGDMINRQAAIDITWEEPSYTDALNVLTEVRDKVRTLPSIISQPRTGHWIEGQTDNPNIHNILCSCCFEGYPSKGHANSQYTKEKFQWCPKCGAKMVEPQESEEKE